MNLTIDLHEACIGAGARESHLESRGVGRDTKRNGRCHVKWFSTVCLRTKTSSILVYDM